MFIPFCFICPPTFPPMFIIVLSCPSSSLLNRENNHNLAKFKTNQPRSMLASLRCLWYSSEIFLFDPGGRISRSLWYLGKLLNNENHNSVETRQKIVMDHGETIGNEHNLLDCALKSYWSQTTTPTSCKLSLTTIANEHLCEGLAQSRNSSREAQPAVARGFYFPSMKSATTATEKMGEHGMSSPKDSGHTVQGQHFSAKGLKLLFTNQAAANPFQAHPNMKSHKADQQFFELGLLVPRSIQEAFLKRHYDKLLLAWVGQPSLY